MHAYGHFKLSRLHYFVSQGLKQPRHRLLLMLALSLMLHAGIIEMTKSDINQGKTEIIKPLEVRLIKKSRLESSPNSTPPPIQKSEYQLLKPNTEPSLQDYPKHSAISIPIKTYYKISELDVIPQPTIPIEPEYPVSVPPSVQSGIVRLELFLDEDGMVTDINILNSHPQEYFEEAAKKAFLHAQFTPGIKEGKKVKCVMTLQVHFGNN